jgi:hypothetical protein
MNSFMGPWVPGVEERQNDRKVVQGQTFDHKQRFAGAPRVA